MSSSYGTILERLFWHVPPSSPGLTFYHHHAGEPEEKTRPFSSRQPSRDVADKRDDEALRLRHLVELDLGYAIGFGLPVHMLSLSRTLAKQSFHIGCTDADLLVMGLAQLDVIVDIEIAVRLALVIQPDQRPLDDEEDFHRVRMLVGDQGMSLSRRLVDEVAGCRGPVVLQVSPLA